MDKTKPEDEKGFMPHGLFCECEECERFEREADEATKCSLLQARHREYATGMADWDNIDTMAILAGDRKLS